MAVFFLNDCKFRGCGMKFTTLSDLIQHVEDTHIDSDPKTLEMQEIQQPASLALSYILRCYTDNRNKSRAIIPIRCSTPIESEFEDDLETNSDIDDESDDSWTTQEFTYDVILGMVNTKDVGEVGEEKPLACPVPGCTKRYKNINGMKYHARNSHKKEVSQVKKAYTCHCGKHYKTEHGIRQHTLSQHGTEVSIAKTASHLVPPKSTFSSSNTSFLIKHLPESALKLLTSRGIPAECSANAILSECKDILDESVDSLPASRQSTPSPVAIKRVPMPKVHKSIPFLTNEEYVPKDLAKTFAIMTPSQVHAQRLNVSMETNSMNLIGQPKPAMRSFSNGDILA